MMIIFPVEEMMRLVVCNLPYNNNRNFLRPLFFLHNMAHVVDCKKNAKQQI